MLISSLLRNKVQSTNQSISLCGGMHGRWNGRVRGWGGGEGERGIMPRTKSAEKVSEQMGECV